MKENEKVVHEFLNELLNSKLERDNETYFYSLGSKKLDRIFTLPNEQPVYTPNSEDVECFANISYILALAGCKPTNFTSVPTGFLMSVEDANGETKTFFINQAMEKWNREILINIVKDVADSNNSKFHKNLLEALESDKTLRDLCIDCGKYKTSDLLTDAQKERIASSILEFNSDSEHPNSLNNQNCNNNHKILKNVCRHDLGVVLGKSTKEEDAMVDELYDLTLFHWILPGYKAYRGKTINNEPIDKQGQILNERALEVLERFPDYHDACAVLNMCSTDYTADIVYAIISTYEKELSKEETNSTIKDVNPPTPHNIQDKQAIWNLTREFANEKTK